MPRQQQVDDALARAFAGRPPSGKVRAALTHGGPGGSDELQLHHYHHLLLRWDIARSLPLYQWHEKPTDKRILRAALQALAEGNYSTRPQLPSATAGGAPAKRRRRTADAGVALAGAPGASAAAAAAAPGSGSAVVSQRRCSLGGGGGGGLGDVTVARGEAVEERGSVFVALVAWPVRSARHGAAAVAQLRRDPTLAGASGWRWWWRQWRRRRRWSQGIYVIPAVLVPRVLSMCWLRA
jgi:hypothetical protein